MQLTKGNDLNNGRGGGEDLCSQENGGGTRWEAASLRYCFYASRPFTRIAPFLLLRLFLSRRSRFVPPGRIDSSFPWINGKYENCGTLIAYFSDDSTMAARARAQSDETSRLASWTQHPRALCDLRVCLLFILYFPRPCPIARAFV